MTRLRYTLLSDGSSDRALMPILDWLLLEHAPTCVVESNWADLRRLPQPPKGLANRLKVTAELYPCELLFVHRDAERETQPRRLEEISQEWESAFANNSEMQLIRIVPVRMQEAWMLVDERAIRRAAGNPNGVEKLDLPELRRLEAVPDPKDVLNRALLTASGLNGRRLKRFAVSGAAQRVTNFIQDFSILRQLAAFTVMENELVQVVAEMDIVR